MVASSKVSFVAFPRLQEIARASDLLVPALSSMRRPLRWTDPPDIAVSGVSPPPFHFISAAACRSISAASAHPLDRFRERES